MQHRTNARRLLSRSLNIALTRISLLAGILVLSACGDEAAPPLAPIPDTVSPTVQIVSPGRDTTYVRDGALPGKPLVRGVASDTIGVVRATYQLNGRPEVELPIKPGTSVAIAFALDLVEGENELELFAYDAADNRSSSGIRHIRSDNLGPQIQILSPRADSTVKAATVVLRVRVTDPSGVDRFTYQLNGGFPYPIVVGDTAATIEVPISVELGPSGINVRAYDVKGNWRTASVAFRRGGARFNDVSVGSAGFCAIDTEGLVYCETGSGRLGQKGGDRRYLSVASSTNSVCAISTSQALYCWNSSYSSAVETVVELLPGTRFRSLSAGPAGACGITTSGALYCWALDTFGAAPHPQAVAGGPFSTVSVGFNATCAIAESGQAFCWGQNTSGQLGTGNTEAATVPTPVATDLRFQDIATRGGHTCAIAIDGTAYCWGNNQLGQLGTGSVSTDSTPRTTPVAVAGGLHFASIAVGGASSCGLVQDGAAYCWGDNLSAQLGTGDNHSHPTPTPVAGGIAWTKISTANVESCALSTDHLVFCWGQQANSPQRQEGQ
jgi:alpha-tubulin suppressor-like RCC1 family protein